MPTVQPIEFEDGSSIARKESIRFTVDDADKFLLVYLKLENDARSLVVWDGSQILPPFDEKSTTVLNGSERFFCIHPNQGLWLGSMTLTVRALNVADDVEVLIPSRAAGMGEEC